VTAFRCRRSAVLRQVLEWGLTHGQGWKIDRSRPPSRAQRVFLRLEPEVRERVEAAATAAGGDVSAWLRHAVARITVADFPASWHTASSEWRRAPMRSHASHINRKRFMMRLDDASTRRLDELAQHFNRSAADIISLKDASRPYSITKRSKPKSGSC
jgi:predicted transcriptional regulator